MAAEKCIACGAPAPFVPIYERDGFAMVRCGHCGLVFQSPQPSDADLLGTYYHDEEWTKTVLGPLREKLRDRARLQLGLLTAAGIPPGRLLDVGCSSGEFMALAQEAGWRTTGVELGEATAAAARARGLDVHTGTLEQVAGEVDPGSFSVITFWDVLEHLRDPRVELDLARSLLRPAGVLAATMPNVAGLYPRATYRLIARRTGRWEYPELPVHLYDFSPRTAARVLENAGYREVAVRTFPTPFWYYRWTSLSRGALGGGRRALALRGAFELLRLPLYPLARLSDSQNSQFVTARS
jgi:SAM-dependent methyltransferase